MKRLALALAVAAIAAAAIPSMASAQSGSTAYDACYAKDGTLDGSFSPMWEGDPNASPTKPGCDQIAMAGDRVAVRASGQCWAKDGLGGSFNLMAGPGCAQIALGADNRMVDRNTDGSCWAKDGLWGAWNLMAGPGCAQIAAGDNRIVDRNTDGSCWAKEGMFGNWNLMAGPNCAEIYLGDNRMVVRGSDNVCWAKEGMWGSWALMWDSGGTCAQIAVGGGRIAIRTTDGRCWGRDGMTGSWVMVWGSGCAQVAVGGTRVGIRTTDDRCYAKDGLSGGAWVAQWEFSPCADIVLSGTRVGIRVDNPANMPPTWTPSISDPFEATLQGGAPDFPHSFAWGAWCTNCDEAGKLLDGTGGHIDQVAPSGFAGTNGAHVVEAELASTSTRAEIQCHRSASTGPGTHCAGGEGTEFAYEFDLRVPSGYTLPGRETNVMQTHPTPVATSITGYPHVDCYGGGLQIKAVPGDASKVELLFRTQSGAITDDANGFCTSTGTLDSLGTYSKDAWHRFKLHARWSTQPSTGLVQAWVDGQERLPLRSQATLIGGSGREQFFRIGLYETASHQSFRVYYDNVVIRENPGT